MITGLTFHITEADCEACNDNLSGEEFVDTSYFDYNLFYVCSLKETCDMTHWVVFWTLPDSWYVKAQYSCIEEGKTYENYIPKCKQ